MPGRVAGRDDCFQDATGALGQRIDPDGKEDSSAGAKERCAAPYQNRSVVSPDGKHQLSPDDHAFGPAAPSHDYSLLSGLVPDALHRSAAVHGVDVFDFQFLFGFATGAVSSQLASCVVLSPISHGAGNRP